MNCSTGNTNLMIDEKLIPASVRDIINRIEDNGFRAYIVGGAVRDLFLNKAPKDWDISSSAQPDEVLALFPGAHSAGARFGTITISTQEVGPVEITTFRTEGPYSDGRRPDYVEFTDDLILDLSRRDFTCNSLAWHPREGLIDPFHGRQHLNRGVLRCVGDPDQRLKEDALRILRAFRLQLALDLKLDSKLARSLCVNAPLVSGLPEQRIGREMYQLLAIPRVYKGIRRLWSAGVLPLILPELAKCYGLDQNRFHAYSVFTHTLVALKHGADDLEVQTAILLHDLGKAQVPEQVVDGIRRFWGHQEASAQLADKVLLRWGWPAKSRERIVTLVGGHMFYWPENPTDRALRRFIAKVGPELILPLMEVRKADIVGLGPRGKTRLSPWHTLVQRIQGILLAENVFSLKDLTITGTDLLELGIPEGPQVGRILAALFEMVLEEDIPNEPDVLLQKARRLWLSDG